MFTYCEGCSSNRKGWGGRGPEIHRALVVAGSISNSQRRTMKFETSGNFSQRPEMESDIVINIGRKALLSFLYDEDRPMLALDMWKGRDDDAKFAQQMSSHRYTVKVLALDEPTDKEIQRRGAEKLYGTPVYIVRDGGISLRGYDPDGSTVLFDIPRIS